jgi:hypothetical protein
MTKSRKATPATLTEWQRGRLERLWFVFGNHGPKTTPGNHQFIQGLLEHGLDLRPLHTKRTPKSERPTPECEQAVEAVLEADGDGGGGVDVRYNLLRLVSSSGGERKSPTPDPELKELLDDIRLRRLRGLGRDVRYPGGEDAA